MDIICLVGSDCRWTWEGVGAGATAAAVAVALFLPFRERVHRQRTEAAHKIATV